MSAHSQNLPRVIQLANPYSPRCSTGSPSCLFHKGVIFVIFGTCDHRITCLSLTNRCNWNINLTALAQTSNRDGELCCPLFFFFCTVQCLFSLRKEYMYFQCSGSAQLSIPVDDDGGKLSKVNSKKL